MGSLNTNNECMYVMCKYLLDSSQFHVFVPVTDSGLGGVARTALELLRSVLHSIDKLKILCLCCERKLFIY